MAERELPTVCFMSRKIKKEKQCFNPPTHRVMGEFLVMHVCSDCVEAAQHIVGEPYITTALNGAKTVSDEALHLEAMALRLP